MEHLGMFMATIAADASAAAVAGDSVTVPQIAAYVVAVLVGGGAAYKVIPILLARLAVSLAGARSEKDAIERLEGQLAAANAEKAAVRTAADTEIAQARQAANDAYKERNDILRELGDVKAQLAALTERATQQAQTIDRQNQQIATQIQQIAELTAQISQLREAVHGKAL